MPTSRKDLQAGQRLMIGFNGRHLDPELKSLLNAIRPAGVILFSPNLKDPRQIADLCRDIQNHARSLDLPPMLVAIDQEGGAVKRLAPPFTQFEGNPAMKDQSDAVRFAQVTARELKSVGINMNMAPVLDVVPEGQNSVMAKRAFRGGPRQVAQMGAVVIDHLQRAGILAVAKHFPGIGRTSLDSHLDLPVLETPDQTLMESDLVPFARAIEHNVAAIMLSHVLYTALDPRWPASLSPAIAHRLLRRQMGYRGLIITDDLDMGAIREHFSIETAVEQIAASGIDLALVCHQGPAMEQAYNTLARVIESDSRIAAAHQESLERIRRAKARLQPPG